MEIERFRSMVARLEADSARHPRGYLLRVAALALLGFGLLALVLGVAGFGLVVIVGIGIALLLHGGAALVILLKFAKVLWLLALPLWFLVRSSMRALFVRLPPPAGEPVTAAQAPALFDAIATLRRRLRGPKVHQVLIVDEVNAAIVQRPLFGLVGFPRNHLLLGLPLLESMTPDEALAVVAHEYGHLAGSHGHFAAYIYRLRLSWGTVQAVAEQWQGRIGQALARAVGWYAPYFNAYTFVLARANEYQADRSAADLVGVPVVAAALKRVNVAGPQYQAFIGATFDGMAEQPKPPADLSLRWAAAAVAPPDDAARWLGDALQRRSDVADTHPALRDRLAALGAADDATLPAPAVQTAAQAWLGPQLATLRQFFQSRWADAVAQPWAERHEALLAQRARLAELRGQAERSRDEDFERLRLSVQLEPRGDWLAEVAAFNAATPDHPGALYIEASLRLDRDDEAGLALLERVIALDVEATKPACERAYTFWRARHDEDRAEPWAARWRARDALENGRQRQAGQLDTAHAVQPHGLPAETLAALQTLLANVDRAGIAALYLVRRVLPADPQQPSYVLGIEMTWMAKRRGKHQALVDRLAALGWPFHVVVCTLDGTYGGRYARRVKAVAGARLP